MTNKTKFIIDVNRHGIRRERPAVGYKAYRKQMKELYGSDWKKKIKKDNGQDEDM
jgi:hypothetical protein